MCDQWNLPGRTFVDGIVTRTSDDDIRCPGTGQPRASVRSNIQADIRKDTLARRNGRSPLGDVIGES